MESRSRIYRIVRSLVEFICRGVAAGYYTLIYVFIESPKIRHNRGLHIEAGTSLNTELWCIFAIYQRNQISNNLVAFLVQIRNEGYNVILVNDGSCSGELIQAFLPHCHTVINKPPGGRDFGAYKWGTEFLSRLGVPIRQVVYCNDSVFIRPSALAQLLQRIPQTSDDYIGITETYFPCYHVQSWFFAISGVVFTSAAFQAFWRGYKPLSYRLHCINKGEITLSQHLMQSGFQPHLLYTQNMVLDLIFDGTMAETVDRLLELLRPQEYQRLLDTIRQLVFVQSIQEDIERSNLKRETIELLTRSNTMNAANLLLLNSTAFPFLKKDLVYRGQYPLHQIENVLGQWVGEDAEHAREILAYFRCRGTLRARVSPPALLARLGVI
jgi:hypothetical protein